MISLNSGYEFVVIVVASFSSIAAWTDFTYFCEKKGKTFPEKIILLACLSLYILTIALWISMLLGVIFFISRLY